MNEAHAPRVERSACDGRARLGDAPAARLKSARIDGAQLKRAIARAKTAAIAISEFVQNLARESVRDFPPVGVAMFRRDDERPNDGVHERTFALSQPARCPPRHTHNVSHDLVSVKTDICNNV
jgi:hypothetical protein